MAVVLLKVVGMGVALAPTVTPVVPIQMAAQASEIKMCGSS